MSGQRGENWFNQRIGRFTASEIHKLLGVNGLGETGITYAFEKACEIVFGRNLDPVVSFDMKRGIYLEPFAFEKFKELKALDFVEVKEAGFFPFGSDSGASPDGLVDDDSTLEIKCPNPIKFFNLIKDGEAAIDKKYIAQMQHQMMCTNSIKCHFFNYIIYNDIPMWHEIIVKKDDKFISFIKERIKEAVKYRDEFVLKLKDNIQFKLDQNKSPISEKKSLYTEINN